MQASTINGTIPVSNLKILTSQNSKLLTVLCVYIYIHVIDLLICIFTINLLGWEHQPRSIVWMVIIKFYSNLWPSTSNAWFLGKPIPIWSMYGIFTYIYHKNQSNVGKYYHTWILWDMKQGNTMHCINFNHQHPFAPLNKNTNQSKDLPQNQPW